MTIDDVTELTEDRFKGMIKRIRRLQKEKMRVARLIRGCYGAMLVSENDNEIQDQLESLECLEENIRREEERLCADNLVGELFDWIHP